MQSAWKREPTMPTFTLDMGRSRVTLAPSRLPGLQRHASDPAARRLHVSQRLRQADLGREIRGVREVAQQMEVMRGAGRLRFGVDLAQELLALVARKRG